MHQRGGVTKSQEFRLASRPIGKPTLENFELTVTSVPEAGEGEVLVRNTWLSVDPYMRGRMDAGESYIAPFEVGGVLEGHAVGEVVESRSVDVPVGSTVLHFAGWRQYAVLDAADATVLDVSIARPEDYLSALGQTSFTAYLAVAEIAQVCDGDAVFVSGAAGAVGSVAGQLARKYGAARVIGSAGGAEKTRILTEEFGFDAAIDYRAGSITDQLSAAAPDGIDVYIDNVGGDHLQAAITALKPHGRVALIGMISTYNSPTPVPGPTNLYDVVLKQLTLQGLLITDHLDRLPTYITQASHWLADGTLRTKETVIEGLAQAPHAFLGLLSGTNTGKMLVRL
jgi:NADPH-dependent curcumin reductase CurA